MRIRLHGEWHRGRRWPVDYGNRGGDIVLEAFGQWLRLAAYVGSPPGSHIGVWRTRGGLTGALQGINVRVGRRYIGPCLTVLAHTRPSRGA